MFTEILHRESGITASAIFHIDADHERIHAIMRRKSNGMAEIRHMVALLKEAAHLFRHFAPLHGIEKEINIRAVNRSGAYVCDVDCKARPGRGVARFGSACAPIWHL